MKSRAQRQRWVLGCLEEAGDDPGVPKIRSKVWGLPKVRSRVRELSESSELSPGAPKIRSKVREFRKSGAKSGAKLTFPKILKGRRDATRGERKDSSGWRDQNPEVTGRHRSPKISIEGSGPGEDVEGLWRRHTGDRSDRKGSGVPFRNRKANTGSDLMPEDVCTESEMTEEWICKTGGHGSVRDDISTSQAASGIMPEVTDAEMAGGIPTACGGHNKSLGWCWSKSQDVPEIPGKPEPRRVDVKVIGIVRKGTGAIACEPEPPDGTSILEYPGAPEGGGDTAGGKNPEQSGRVRLLYQGMIIVQGGARVWSSAGSRAENREVVMEGMEVQSTAGGGQHCRWNDSSVQIVETGDLENTVICRAKRGKRDLRDLRTWTQVRSVRKKTGGSPVGCSRNTTARKDGERMRIEDSGGSHVTPDGPGRVPEGLRSDPEEAGGSEQTPLEPNTNKCSGRRAWEPGLICDSAGDLEDARKGTEEAPDEVKGIWLRMQMTGGKNNKDKQDPEVSGRLRNEDEIAGRLSP
ncbi:hypothetical protein DFH07DRAFT_767534 [Mycena maculata]|uniref:Uncharacterized protein n=1 Tax=Mycena maculata TaxID=230809 RepID=A0AAD7JX05_9AGAR|nr:hypothetical protein DFH07DRAFT_767534 [Mycena maculata]